MIYFAPYAYFDGGLDYSCANVSEPRRGHSVSGARRDPSNVTLSGSGQSRSLTVNGGSALMVDLDCHLFCHGLETANETGV